MKRKEQPFLVEEALKPMTRRTALNRAAGVGLGMTAIPSVLAIAGCGDDDSNGGTSSATTLNAMDHYLANVTSIESTDRGFEWGVNGLEGEFSHLSYDGDQQKMISQPLQFPAQGFNGVLFYLIADSAMSQYAKQLTDNEIAVINYANRLPWFTPADPQFNGYFLTHTNGPFAEEGYVVSRLLFERGDGEGEAIILGGVKGDASDNARTFGVQKALEEFPDVKVVAQAYTDWDTTKAQEELSKLLPAHPDVKFIVGMNDSIALGALGALRGAGNETALVMGVDGDPAFLKEMIKDDRVVATSAGRLEHTGVLAAVWMYDWLNGVEYNPLESLLDTDSIVLDTPESAQAMLDLVGERPDPLPYDPKKMSRHLQGDDWVFQHRVQVANPTDFDWGDKPGVNQTPKPEGFEWPEAYQAALDNGDLETLNEDYASRVEDVYGPVREKTNYQEQGVIGAFKQLGIA